MIVTTRTFGCCPICKSDAGQEFIPEISFDLPVKEGLPTQIKIYYCPSCNFAYNSFTGDSSAFDAYYQRNANDFYSDCGFDQRFIDQRDLILSLAVHRPEKVLDFGAGSVRLVSEFKRLGINAIGTDIETEFTAYQGVKYDLIVVSHVLEHLIDPVSQVVILSDLLSASGMIYIEVPNPANYFNHPSFEFLRHIDRLHINHFSPEALTEIANCSNLAVTDMGNFDFEYLDGTTYPASYFMLKKKEKQCASPMEIKKPLAQILKQYGAIEKARATAKFNDVEQGFIAYGMGDNFFRTFGIAGVEEKLKLLTWCDGRFSGELHLGTLVFYIQNLADLKTFGEKAYVFVTGLSRKSIKENLLALGFNDVEFC